MCVLKAGWNMLTFFKKPIIYPRVKCNRVPFDLLIWQFYRSGQSAGNGKPSWLLGKVPEMLLREPPTKNTVSYRQLFYSELQLQFLHLLDLPLASQSHSNLGKLFQGERPDGPRDRMHNTWDSGLCGQPSWVPNPLQLRPKHSKWQLLLILRAWPSSHFSFLSLSWPLGEV